MTGLIADGDSTVVITPECMQVIPNRALQRDLSWLGSLLKSRVIDTCTNKTRRTTSMDVLSGCIHDTELG